MKILLCCWGRGDPPLQGGVPAGRQGQVDDHVHRDQVGHSVVVGSHGAQDPFPGLERERGQTQPEPPGGDGMCW